MRQTDIDRPLNHNRFLAVLAFRHPRLGKNCLPILARVPFAIWTKIFEYVGERDCWTSVTLSEEERARLRTPLVQKVARATEVCEDWPAYEARVFKGARGRLSDREQCMKKNWETRVLLHMMQFGLQFTFVQVSRESKHPNAIGELSGRTGDPMVYLCFACIQYRPSTAFSGTQLKKPAYSRDVICAECLNNKKTVMFPPANKRKTKGRPQGDIANGMPFC